MSSYINFPPSKLPYGVVKRFDFQIGQHIYSYRYRDPLKVIREMDKLNLSMIDMWELVQAFHKVHHK